MQLLRTLLQAGISKSQTARQLNISRPTLDTIITSHNLTHLTEKSNLSDQEMDVIMSDAKAELPSFGERMVIGYFQSRSVKVTRDRIRESIMRVDADGLAKRN